MITAVYQRDQVSGAQAPVGQDWMSRSPFLVEPDHGREHPVDVRALKALFGRNLVELVYGRDQPAGPQRSEAALSRDAAGFV
jgi:hypothetical protein